MRLIGAHQQRHSDKQTFTLGMKRSERNGMSTRRRRRRRRRRRLKDTSSCRVEDVCSVEMKAAYSVFLHRVTLLLGPELFKRWHKHKFHSANQRAQSQCGKKLRSKPKDSLRIWLVALSRYEDTNWYLISPPCLGISSIPFFNSRA